MSRLSFGNSFSSLNLLSCLVTQLIPICWLAGSLTAQEKITFDDHVKPIFQQRCAACHNGNKQSGGLDLTNYTNLMQGGGSGQSVEPGEAGASYLYLLVTHEETPIMPPGGSKIPGSEIKIIETWINSGALENSGSVAKVKKKVATSASVNVGVRPEYIAYPLRISLEPHHIPENGGLVTAVSVSPWAPVTALGATKQILLYDNARMQFLGALPFPTGRANVLQFSPNGRLLLAAGGRQGLLGKIFLWDVESLDLVGTFGEETDTILAAGISADHYLVALGGPQKMLRVYNTTNGDLIYEIKKHTDWITSLSFSPDGVLLASADRNGGLQIWEAESGNEYLSLGGHSKAITAMSWRGDANVLATSSEDGTIKLWEMERGRQVKSWSAHRAGVTSLDFNRDGLLVSVGRENTAKLWQQDGTQVRKFAGLGEFGVCCHYCDESNRIIVSDFAGQVRVYDAQDGKLVSSLATVRQSLRTSVEQANQLLTNAMEELEPKVESAKKVNRQVRTLQERLETAIANRDSTVNTQSSLQTKSADVSRQLEKAEKLRSAWQTALTAAEESLPAMEQAARSAAIAAEKLPGDAELAELAQKMTEKYDGIKGRIQLLDNKVTQSIADDELLESNLSAIQSEIELASQSLVATNENIEELNTKLTPLTARAEKANQAVQSLQTRIQQLRVEIEFWNGEIEFDRLMKEMQIKVTAAQELVNQKEIQLSTTKQTLEAAQKEHDAKLSERDQAVENVTKRRLELRNLRSRK